jgi:hypothetical protein
MAASTSKPGMVERNRIDITEQRREGKRLEHRTRQTDRRERSTVAVSRHSAGADVPYQSCLRRR